MSGGSRQLRIFRCAIRDGVSIEAAAKLSGLGLAEAKLTVAEDAKNPPPAEAFEMIGDNSEGAMMADNISAEQLRQFVERIERLEEEKRGFAEDIKDVYSEAKSTGFDGAAIRECIKLRRIEKQKRDERAATVQLYGEQLGLF